jgi:pyruvate/2-oxoglutarate dehydrogenase complex dihydrolipoamide dehydrogenase (E3) component
VIEKSRLSFGREDADVSQGVLDIMRNDGVVVETGAECMLFELRGDKIAVGLDCDGIRTRSSRFAVLLAVGRCRIR